MSADLLMNGSRQNRWTRDISPRAEEADDIALAVSCFHEDVKDTAFPQLPRYLLRESNEGREAYLRDILFQEDHRHFLKGLSK